MKITHETREINGRKVKLLRIQTEAGRHIEAKKLDMADQWDVMELVGSGDPGRGWIAIALVAASVVSIDGRPVDPGDLSREGLRVVLRNLAEDGLDAVREALSSGEILSEDAHKAQVGNS